MMVHNNHLLAVYSDSSFGSGILIYQLSNPAQLSLTAHIDGFGIGKTIAVDGTIAYIGAERGGVKIVDMQNPAYPVLLSSLDTHSANSIVVRNNYLYLADGREGVKIIDVSDPSQPSIVSSVDDIYGVEIALSGNYAYVSDYPWSLTVVDISNPLSPVYVSSATPAPTPDGQTPVTTQVPPEYPPPTETPHPNEWRPGDIAVTGNTSYLRTGIEPPLRIYDISIPSAPVVVQTEYIAATDFCISGQYLYCSNNGNVLVIYDISEPAAPVLAGTLENTGEKTEGVAVSGNYAYVGMYEALNNRLQVVDISDPSSPESLGTFPVSGFPQAVYVQGNLIFVMVEARVNLVEIFRNQ